MGWAARANPNAQDAKAGVLKPRIKERRVSIVSILRNRFVSEHAFDEAWEKMRARIDEARRR